MVNFNVGVKFCSKKKKKKEQVFEILHIKLYILL